MKVLYINTADKIVKLGFFVTDEKSYFSEFKQDNNLVEILYEKIEKFLAKYRTKISDLTHVAVFRGPGGFTSLRIGAVTANAINFVQKTPLLEISEKEEKNLEDSIKKKIAKKDFKKIIVPLYGKEPNITSPR